MKSNLFCVFWNTYVIFRRLYGCLYVYNELLLIAKLFWVTGVMLGENRLYFQNREKRTVTVSDWRFTSVFIMGCARQQLCLRNSPTAGSLLWYQWHENYCVRIWSDVSIRKNKTRSLDMCILKVLRTLSPWISCTVIVHEIILSKSTTPTVSISDKKS